MLQVAVVELEHIDINCEIDIAALTRLQRYSFKALQLLDGAAYCGCHVADIKLNNLVGVILASVLYVDSESELAICVHRRAAQAWLAIFKGGVAQSIAERIERIVAH